MLQNRHQIYLSGIVLFSSVAFSNFGADDRNTFFLPTYIMSAWYHKLLPPDLQKLSAEEMAEKAREFAHGEYAQALDKGDKISPSDYQTAVKDIARYTGLSTKYLEQAICESVLSDGFVNWNETNGKLLVAWTHDSRIMRLMQRANAPISMLAKSLMKACMSPRFTTTCDVN